MSVFWRKVSVQIFKPTQVKNLLSDCCDFTYFKVTTTCLLLVESLEIIFLNVLCVLKIIIRIGTSIKDYTVHDVIWYVNKPTKIKTVYTISTSNQHSESATIPRG